MCHQILHAKGNQPFNRNSQGAFSIYGNNVMEAKPGNLVGKFAKYKAVKSLDHMKSIKSALHAVFFSVRADFRQPIL